ncbi:protein Cbp3p, mitochondrial [[Candida] jaroonii]|uniref:Protein Cbp3p, mitochondrial n=1 Tax=[Candida] jaroonii TaxID=467808 RepID=A0ACA9Y0B6_9ASCO|nr:protein Cbp3p, mitochondrial [[Candida] jaroonii]
MIRQIRTLSSSNLLRFETRSILSKLNQKDVESPSSLASESTLPHIEQDLKVSPRQAKAKAAFLSDNKLEKKDYQLSGFSSKIGQMVINVFHLDMDKARSGSVAGSKYFGECKRQGLYYPNEPLSDTAKFFYQTLKLPMSFSQWFQITTLHYWMLSVRMRAMPFKHGRNYQQKLIDRIFKDMELRMNEELGINSNSVIEKFLKDYHTQVIGCVFSYDEGLMTDDITLASALWRNVFNGDPNVDIRHVESLLGYVRSQLYVLNKMTDREFGFGDFEFVSPDQTVRPLTKAQEEEMKKNVRMKYESMKLPSQRSELSLDE